MKPKARAILQLPPGAESFHLDEAQEHEELLQKLRVLYGSWGYLPVKTPVFDFYDIYRPLLDASAREKIYRLIDREGELLLLRSDVTLFLAKQAGAILSGRGLPLRVWYADTILRHQDAEDISKNEFFQAGAELIGLPGAFADLEALCLLVRSMETAGLRAYRIHLGSRGVFDAVFGGLPEERRMDLLAAVSLRNGGLLRRLLAGMEFPAERTEFLVRFFLYIGDPAGLAKLRREGAAAGHLPTEAEAPAAHLAGLWAELEKIGYSRLFRIDLSETASQPYYTGIVFQAYTDGVDSAFASGGRYDGLLARFGFDAPSVGFSIMLRKIEAILPRSGAPARKAPRKIRGASFAEAFAAAEELRRNGEAAVIAGDKP